MIIYHYGGKVFQGESLMNLRNNPLFAKLKQSKFLLMYNYDLLAEPIVIHQNFC